METDSFINALRRFLADRGPIRQLRCDCGSNFGGARNELQDALQEMDQERVRAYLLKENCDWIEFRMNFPAASNMGSVWERMTRSVHSVLAALLKEAGTQLNDESYRTLMKEVQSIVNSRSLTVSSWSSTEEPEPLTPNHNLTMKTKVLLPPPGVFQREDMYLQKRWRRVQHLANQFWLRWKREFLHTMQVRNNWIKPQRTLQPDDIVLMKDDDQPRSKWKLARVEEAYASEDGLVRKVKLAMSTPKLDKQGRRQQPIQYLDRPVNRLVLLQPVDRGILVEEPAD